MIKLRCTISRGIRLPVPYSHQRPGNRKGVPLRHIIMQCLSALSMSLNEGCTQVVIEKTSLYV